MRGRISILHLERGLILFTLLAIVWVTGCGEEEKTEPVYLIDYTSEGIPGSSLKVWFSGEVISVRFNGQPARRIYYDEEKGLWTAKWKLPDKDELARSGMRINGYISVYVEWTDEMGGTRHERIILPCGCCSWPEVLRTIPMDRAEVDAEEINRKGIIVVFSEPISLKISEDVFVLRNSSGKRLKWEVWWSSDNSIAILKPKEGMELKPGEKYTLRIKDYFDPAGNEGVEVKVAFTTKST